MMTVKEIRDRLWASRGIGGIELGNDEFAEILESLDAHAAQPQPVAQGEAVVEFYVKCVRCHGEGMADIYVGSTGGSFMDPPDPVFERDACPECEGACFVPTTPSIPTAQRVVPVEPHTNDNYEQDENGCVDVYSEGHKDGWNSCRESMLAAAPDAGGV